MGLFFPKARYMNVVGFEILARKSVPHLPSSYTPLPHTHASRVQADFFDNAIIILFACHSDGPGSTPGRGFGD